MRLLVTAGNTQTPIDMVRCVTNIFSGRTGGRIAQTAHDRGHDVQLLTSHPEVIVDSDHKRIPTDSSWQVAAYRTFDDLRRLLAERVKRGGIDAIIHAAAVSDFELAGTYTPAAGAVFDAQQQIWSGKDGPPRLQRLAEDGKIKSRHPELWLRMIPTPKLVDLMRSEWGFEGILVKFKLEVGVSDAELLKTAENSRRRSAANLLVANTLEGMQEWAYLGPDPEAAGTGGYRKVSRAELATVLLTAVEEQFARQGWPE